MTLSPIASAARRHPQLAAGLIVVFVVLAFGPVGTLFVDTDLSRVGAAEPNLSPSLEHLLGTDAAGRDLLAVMVAGTPLTLRVGFLAGAVGLGIGIILGFLAGYFGGLVDTLIRGAADVLLTVPGLLFLVVLATSLRTAVTVDMMALVVASLAWMLPTRTIRSQVLSMRERAYVQVARLSGMRDLEIIARELLPNLLPYLAASFVSAVGAAVLASIGLEALGLGPQNEPTLGMTIYWALYYTSLLRGMWWWWAPPIAMIVLIFHRLVPRLYGIGPHRQSAYMEGLVVSRVVLRVQDLRVHYHTPRGPVRAVESVGFELRAGERLGLVGESGSGKSTTAMALMQLIRPPGRIEGGRVDLDELELLSLSEEEMRAVRFSRISLIPQGVMNSLNPVMRVGAQIADTIEAHEERPDREALQERVRSLLALVELDPATARMYPHELSGGMKQRIGMAIAVALRPQVIIADEPTSALDVVVQKRVMDTLFRVQQELDAAVILVGHDMGLMAQCVDRIGVMYAGRLAELGPVQSLLEEPLHPYTRMLVESLPSLERKGVFRGIPGLPPSLLEPPPGCPFHPRCPQVIDCCSDRVPELEVVAAERQAACHLHTEGFGKPSRGVS